MRSRRNRAMRGATGAEYNGGMKLITRFVKRLLTIDSPSLAHSAAAVLEPMEARLLMSATLPATELTIDSPPLSVNYYKMTVRADGQPIEQRPTESLSLNYTKIEF